MSISLSETAAAQREGVTFRSGTDHCAAWHYQGSNGACVVVISTHDQSVLAAPARKAARRAPAGEILEADGGHYAAFLDQHETVVAAELDFLRRHLLQKEN